MNVGISARATLSRKIVATTVGAALTFGWLTAITPVALAASGGPTVTTAAASVLDSANATLNGSVDNLGDLAGSSVSFCWGTDPALAGCSSVAAVPATVTGAGASGVSTNLTGLVGATTYYYATVATNSGGTSTGSIVAFTTATAAPVVSTQAVSTTTTTSAVLNGTVNNSGNAIPATVSFCYSTSLSTLGACTLSVFADQSPVTGSTDTAITATATNLAPGTTYYFLARANNGVAASGNVQLFATASVIPAVTTSLPTTVDGTWAVLSGTVNNGGNGSPATVTFCYGTDPLLNGCAVVNASIASVSGSATTPVAALITKLAPRTTYYYAVSAMSGGNVGTGQTLSFTTLDASAIATRPVALNISRTSATLSGYVDNAGAANSAAVSFCYGTDSTLRGCAVAASNPSTVSGSGANLVSANIAGLNAGTQYYFAILANNGRLSQSQVAAFFTVPAIVTATTSAATGISVRTATVNGFVNNGGNGTSAIAGFRVGTDPTLAVFQNYFASPNRVSGNSNVAISLSLLNLTPNTTYYYEAVANNGAAIGSIASFKTTIGLPDVSTVAAANVTASSATIAGTVNNNGATSGTTLSFCYGTDPSLSGCVSVAATPATALGASYLGVLANLSGLQPGTTYYYELIGTNSVGVATSSASTFATSIVAPLADTGAASQITSTTALISGTVSDSGNGVAAVPTLCYGTATDANGNPTNIDSGGNYIPCSTVAMSPAAVTGAAVTPVTATLSGLTPGQLYYYQVQASNGLSAVGPVNYFFTLASAPTVALVAVSGLSQTAVTLAATVNNNGNLADAIVEFCWGTTSAQATSCTNVASSDQGLASGSTPVAQTATLTGLQPGRTYYYLVQATNGTLAVSPVSTFKTLSAAPSVTTTAASTVTTNAAHLNGSVNNSNNFNAAVTSFCYGTDPALVGCTTVAASPTPVSGNTTQVIGASITGLYPGTRYYFEAAASNDIAATGAILSFVTSATPARVTTAAATSITTSGATLNGTVNDNLNGTAATTAFCYGTTIQLVGCTTVVANPASVTGGADTAVSVAISGLNPSTTYYYYATANNGAITSGSTMSFKTLAVAPTVTTVAASSVTTTSANLNGTVSNGSNGTAAVNSFCYGTSSVLSSCSSVSATPSSVTGATAMPVSVSLTGLVPDTTYYYQALSSNGASGVGAIMSFTTLVVAPTATTLSPSSVQANSAQLNGTVNNNGNGVASAVSFCYGTDSALTGCTSVTALPASASGSTSTSVSAAISALVPGTSYYFRVSANNGAQANGAIMSFRTPTTPATVTVSAASGVTTTSAVLNGSVNNNGNGTAASVTFCYGTSVNLFGCTSVTASPASVTGASATSVSVSLTGLNPGTTYYYRVSANNGATTSSGTLSVTTTAVAASVSTTGASSVTTTSARLNATVNNNGNGTASTVTFCYGSSATLVACTTVNANPGSVSGTTTTSVSANIANLRPGTTYYYQVLASNGASAQGAIVAFATVGAAATATSSAATSISASGATLNGFVNDNNNGSSATVTFCYGTDPTLATCTSISASPGTVSGASNTSVSATLTGLTTKTRYYFRVIAINGTAPSTLTTYGSIYNFTTL